MSYKGRDNSLLHILKIHRISIEVLADAWLALDVQAFSIWKDKLLACWPTSAWDTLVALEHSDAMVYASIIQDDQIIGKIGVLGNGILGPARKIRLQADAQLFSQLITLQAKFERSATELIAQGQLKMEIDLAANIQIQLLPTSFPSVEGLDIYASSSPATQVGGDFYDFTASKNRPFVFAVGDVSGKGLPAALFMTMTRIVLHAAARFIPDVDPKMILRRVNEDLYDDFTEVGMFATVFIGCYDRITERLIYANAGHSPVIYCSAEGSAMLLQADSTAVGVLPVSGCASHSLPFHSNDILVAGTDGLNECMNLEGEMFGYERLIQTVKDLANLPSYQIGTQLLEIVNSFTAGSSQLDDQTIFIVKGT